MVRFVNLIRQPRLKMKLNSLLDYKLIRKQSVPKPHVSHYIV